MGRRKILKAASLTALGLVAPGMVYPFLEAKWCRVVRRTIALPNLPLPFRGTTVALLADVHHGPFVPLAYIRHVVAIMMPSSFCHTIPTSLRTYATVASAWS
jgi:predicted MPP superfamily phosphohydrolase